jgi:hypothetical protein
MLDAGRAGEPMSGQEKSFDRSAAIARVGFLMPGLTDDGLARLLHVAEALALHHARDLTPATLAAEQRAREGVPTEAASWAAFQGGGAGEVAWLGDRVAALRAKAQAAEPICAVVCSCKGHPCDAARALRVELADLERALDEHPDAPPKPGQHVRAYRAEEAERRWRG